MILGLQEDAHHFSQQIGYVARIDFETPLFNEVFYPDGTSTGPRIDLWEELHSEYRKRSELFIPFTTLLSRRSELTPSRKKIQHSSAEDIKWQFNTHRKKIASLKNDILGEIVPKYAWLSTHHSDYFCTENENLEFRTSGGGRIQIIKKQIFREPELKAKLRLLEDNNSPIDIGIIDDYLKKMYQSYTWLSQITT